MQDCGLCDIKGSTNFNTKSWLSKTSVGLVLSVRWGSRWFDRCRWFNHCRWLRYICLLWCWLIRTRWWWWGCRLRFCAVVNCCCWNGNTSWRCLWSWNLIWTISAANSPCVRGSERDWSIWMYNFSPIFASFTTPTLKGGWAARRDILLDVFWFLCCTEIDGKIQSKRQAQKPWKNCWKCCSRDSS